VAFRQALDGKRGPVYLDLPSDILSQKVEESAIRWPTKYRVESRPAGDPALVERAIDLLAAAKRPLLVTGSGILWSGASEAMRRASSRRPSTRRLVAAETGEASTKWIPLLDADAIQDQRGPLRPERDGTTASSPG